MFQLCSVAEVRCAHAAADGEADIFGIGSGGREGPNGQLPRVCSNSASGIVAMSRPRIGSPRPIETSTSTSGSR